MALWSFSAKKAAVFQAHLTGERETEVNVSTSREHVTHWQLHFQTCSQLDLDSTQAQSRICMAHCTGHDVILTDVHETVLNVSLQLQVQGFRQCDVTQTSILLECWQANTHTHTAGVIEKAGLAVCQETDVTVVAFHGHGAPRQPGQLRLLLLHCWACPTCCLQGAVPPVCLGVGFFLGMCVAASPPSDSSASAAALCTLQSLTLGELQPVACGQDVDEGRDVDVSVVLASLKQDLRREMYAWRLMSHSLSD